MSDWRSEWQDLKQRYVRSDDKQLDAGIFRSLAVGTGLPPIYQKSTFDFESVQQGRERFLGATTGQGHIYTRLGNPTTEYLERMLVALEAQHVVRAAPSGEPVPVGARIFSSGMGAISTLLISLLKTGDAIIAGSVYGCTHSLLRNLSKFGIEVFFVDTTDTAKVAAVLEQHPNVKLLFIESPSNPRLDVSDIEALSRLSDRHGAALAVDNTFCSPYLQQPFRLGADFVIHSLTKFVNGHSMSIAGALLGPQVYLRDHLFEWYKDLGATPSPLDAWLNGGMLQSLAVRQQAQSETAHRLAALLEQHPAVERVFYPWLPSFRGVEVARRQMRSGGAIISFELKGGIAAGERLMDFFARKDVPIELAVSLGAAISYVQHPASMTHAVVPEADRIAAGITNGLVRLSVGLEGYDQLAEAMTAGLALSG